MRIATIREAKNELPRLVHQAEKGKPVRLTRRGKPVAVLVSEREYERLTQAQPQKRDHWQALMEWRASLPPDFEGFSREEVDSWRDRSPDGGRPPITWD